MCHRLGTSLTSHQSSVLSARSNTFIRRRCTCRIVRRFSWPGAHIGFEKHWRRCCRRVDCSSRVLDCSGYCTPHHAWDSNWKRRRPSVYGRCFGPSCVRYCRNFCRGTRGGQDCWLPTSSPCAAARRTPWDICIPGIRKTRQQLAGWFPYGMALACGCGAFLASRVAIHRSSSV